MKIEKILDSIKLYKLPIRFKILIAKIFIRTLKVEHATNDIILYNELSLWIETKGRPTTSNINYWKNNH